MILLNSESMYPWPLRLMVYRGEYATEWQLVLAFIKLTILPAVIAFFMAQRHLIAGRVLWWREERFCPCTS